MDRRLQDPVDDCDDTVAIPSRYAVDFRFQPGPRIRDRERTGTSFEKRLVVLRVSDADGLAGGEMQLGQGCRETGPLVYAHGQDHDRVVVQDDVKIDPEI